MRIYMQQDVQHATRIWTALTIEILATAAIYVILNMSRVPQDITVLISSIAAFAFVLFGVFVAYKVILASNASSVSIVGGTDGEMAIVQAWSEKLAREVAPDEVDLASLMMDAFLKGGKDRRELFQQAKGGALGAFNPADSLIIFPLLLQAIVTAAPILYSALTSSAINDFLSVIKDAISIRESLRQKQKAEIPPGDEYESLRQSITAISAALQSSGLSQDQRDLVTYRVIKALLEDPHGTISFIQKATEGKPGKTSY